MNEIIGVKTLKMSLGAAAAIILAQKMGLQYAAAAGIITILSIQNTRKESIEMALRRIGATLLALFIGSLMIIILGNHAIVFGAYLCLFIPLAVKCHVTEGIVPASVLVTHLLGAEQVTAALLLNELELMLTGVLVALIFNTYMPSLEEKLIKEKEDIDELLYSIIMEMSSVLKNEIKNLQVEEKLSSLEKELVKAREKAHQQSNNYFVYKKSLYEKYFDMRYSQYQILLYVVKHFEKLDTHLEQAKKIAVLMEQAALTVKGRISVEAAMSTLEEIRLFFKKSNLPVSRNEFENRAMLYQFLTDIEQFLYVKKIFKNHLSDKEIKEYSCCYHE